jgi:hypothetical protein
MNPRLKNIFYELNFFKLINNNNTISITTTTTTTLNRQNSRPPKIKTAKLILNVWSDGFKEKICCPSC